MANFAGSLISPKDFSPGKVSPHNWCFVGIRLQHGSRIDLGKDNLMPYEHDSVYNYEMSRGLHGVLFLYAAEQKSSYALLKAPRFHTIILLHRKGVCGECLHSESSASGRQEVWSASLRILLLVNDWLRIEIYNFSVWKLIPFLECWYMVT